MVRRTVAEVAFYAHLDACRQCRDAPFALCRLGARLLHAAAIAVVDPKES